MSYFDDSLPFKHPSTYPPESGVYVRDWRGVYSIPDFERTISMDLWHPLPPGDPMGRGLWYVWPGWNDAVEAHLPWRPPTDKEKLSFYRENPGAIGWM